jgi:excisionase family DNA binding protein
MAMSFSVKVGAAETGLSERTLRDAISKGELKVMRVGRRVLISPSALDDYLNGRSAAGKAVDRD